MESSRVAMNKTSSVLLSWLLALACGTRLAAQWEYWKVDVITDFTAAGKNAVHPSADHPLYYIPQVVGFEELGRHVAGETQPSPQDMLGNLVKALSSYGYLEPMVISGGHAPVSFQPEPSLILLFNWGYLNPIFAKMGGKHSFLMNRDQMFGLVAGQDLA